MKNNSFELSVLVNGKAVKEYVHPENGHVFIEAKNGTNYTVRIKNNGWGRVMVVLSVDGLDVLKGKSAEKAESGYIVNSYSSLEIKGYRVSDDDVASFVFSDGTKSYATACGKGNSNGVIGVRIYSEKQKPIYNIWPKSNTYPLMPDWDTNPSPMYGEPLISGACNSALYSQTRREIRYTCSLNNSLKQSQTEIQAKAFDMGTAWGKSLEDKVTTVAFEKGNLACQMEVLYASHAALEELGIDFSKDKKIATYPQAFSEYCEPPSGWKR